MNFIERHMDTGAGVEQKWLPELSRNCRVSVQSNTASLLSSLFICYILADFYTFLPGLFFDRIIN